MSTPPAGDAYSGKPRRIHWTCRYPDCLRSFTTWTRRGLRVTCPHCHRVQEGPEGVRRLLEKITKKPSPRTATTLKIVTGNGAAKASSRPDPRPVAPSSSKTAAAAKPPAAKTPALPPPPAKKDMLSRVLGF